MNISTGSTATQTDTMQTQQTASEKQQVSESHKVSHSSKTEDKKDEAASEKGNEFKKYLEEPKSTDKVSIEQMQQQNNLNQIQNIDEQYVNKFGFDTVMSLKNIKSIYSFDTAKISKEDAKFFADLVDNKQFALQQNGSDMNLIKFADEIGPTYKTQQTSKVLSDLIAKAYQEGKPVRLDFDNNCSVILKIDSKGKVSAEFIPSDKAVEAYLRNNISSLRQRFDEQNLPYNDLMYRQSNQNNRERRQNQQKERGE